MSLLEFNTLKINEFKPEAIRCIAYNEKTHQIAISRDGGNIEIWNAAQNLFKETDLIAVNEEVLHGLIWCQNRLFGSGEAGFLYEYDIQNEDVKKKLAVTGGSVLCMKPASHGPYIATGTINGTVCIFEVVDEDVLYHSFHPVRQDQIVSLAWHPTKDTIVTGCLDFVHVFSLSSKGSFDFKVGRDRKDVATVIWCIYLFADMTIAIGDSRGLVSFFNGVTGTEIQRIKTHQADILSMTIVDKGNVLWCGGVDPVLYKIERTNHEHSAKWVKTASRRHHTHTIRTMVHAKYKLYSGGDDTHLFCSSKSQKMPITKCIATPPAGYISVGRKSRTIVLGYPKSMEIWRLGKSETDTEIITGLIPLSENAVKLALFHLKKKDTLKACSICPNGDLVSYSSTLDTIRCLRIVYHENGSVIIEKVKIDSENLSRIKTLKWLNDSTFLAIGKMGLVQVYEVKGNSAYVTNSWTIPGSRLFTVSDSGKQVAYCDSDNCVNVMDLVTRSETKLPRSAYPPTSMCFSPFSNLILALDSNTNLTEFDLKKCSLTDFHRAHLSFLNSVKLATSGLTVTSCFYSQPDKIYMATSEGLVQIMKTVAPPKERPLSKKMKKSLPSLMDDFPAVTIKISKVSNHLIHLEPLSEQSIISLEMDAAQLERKLPMTLYKKMFGV